MATINASFVSSPRAIEGSNTAASPVNHILHPQPAHHIAMRDSEKDDNEDGERQVERTRTRDDDMSTVAEAAATNPELAIQQLLTTYNAAVARAISYDNFIWSTPGVTLAAHAFLFSIALGGVNSQSSRIISMVLSLIISIIIFQVFARHRQAELAMSIWLQDFEGRHFAGLKKEDHLHSRGLMMKKKIASHKLPNGIIFQRLGNYVIWQSAIVLIGLVALATLIMSCVKDELFINPA